MQIPARLAVDAAHRILAQPPANPATIRAVAERCRQIGAVDLAASLYLRLVDAGEGDERTRALADVLGGAPPPQSSSQGLLVPVPVCRRTDFLPPDIHHDVLHLTRRSLGEFAPSEVSADGHGRLDPSKRVSAILRHDSAHRDVFLPLVEALLDDDAIWNSLAIARPVPGVRELQVTCSGANAFFKVHTDSGKERFSTRKLTFVYYFHFLPKKFAGGDLRVYDTISGADGFSSNHYSLFEPVDNSIVLFPSTAVHEVMPVECKSSDLADGRFTINGWFH